MSRRQIALLLLAIGLVVLGGHYVLWVNLLRDTALPASLVTLIIAIYAALLASFVATRILLRDAVHWFGWPGYTTLGFAALLFVCVCAVYPVRLLILAGFDLAVSPLDLRGQVLLARLLAGAATIVAGVLSALGVRTAIEEPRVLSIEVPLARLPRALDGYTITQISDVHLGRTIGRGFAERIVRMANALDADMITITGDLVDGTVRQLDDVVAPFGELRARDGVWLVTGNHEYYVGVDEWIERLGRMGIRVLRNERVAIRDDSAGFDLAGVDDWEADADGHGHDLSRALAGRDRSRALILLAHQPKTILEASQLGVDLQLSGHTHGGQIWPWSLMVRLQQPYVAGLHRRGHSYLYVNRGAGYWGPPMRVGIRPEIARIILRAG